MIITVSNTPFELLPERALWWPDQKALICSDLHWGREPFLQTRGMPIPETSFQVESLIIEQLVKLKDAREWWILGDLIHHPKGMHAELTKGISTWMKKLIASTSLERIRFVPGNHDRAMNEWASDFPIQIDFDGIHANGFSFLHEPTDSCPRYCWYGHMHPKIGLPLMGNETAPCFWVRQHEAYLPAFSRLAGGFEIRNIKPSDRVFVTVEDQIIDLELSAQRR